MGIDLSLPALQTDKYVLIITALEFGACDLAGILVIPLLLFF
jgi:hypothetical protein